MNDMNLITLYDNLYKNEEYNNQSEEINEKKWGLIKDRIRFGKTQTAVDVGCGRGVFLKKLIDGGIQALGIEISGVCCEKWLAGLPFACEDIVWFASKTDDKYDLALCTDVLEHVEPECIDDTIAAIRKLSDRALLCIANYSDPHGDRELHLIRCGPEWWSGVLSKHYGNVELFYDDTANSPYYPFYMFECNQ
ncbi:MAG: methyltransferase domain-containing protein [bacterium]